MIREKVETKIVPLEDLQEKLDDLKGEAILPNIVKHFEDARNLSLLNFMLSF